MTDRYAASTSNLADPGKSDKEVEQIRLGQKLLIYAILLNIGVAILSLFAPSLGVLQFAVLGVSILGLVRLFQGMRIAIWARVLMIISMFIPLINLIVLLVLSSRATKALRVAGYRVGLMGARARAA